LKATLAALVIFPPPRSGYVDLLVFGSTELVEKRPERLSLGVRPASRKEASSTSVISFSTSFMVTPLSHRTRT
jgi:hypothetical protein